MNKIFAIIILGKFWRTEYFYNFLKYTSSLFVAFFSYGTKFFKDWFALWIISAAIACCYSYYWDVTKDWKFF